MECDVNIVVPQNYTIALYFTMFMYNCEADQGLKVGGKSVVLPNRELYYR